MNLSLGPAMARREWHRLLRTRGALGLGIILPLASALVLSRSGLSGASAAGAARGLLTTLALIAGASAGGMTRRDLALEMDAVVDLAGRGEWEADLARAACTAAVAGAWALLVIYLCEVAGPRAGAAGGWHPVAATALVAGLWGLFATAMARHTRQDFPAFAIAFGVAGLALSDAFRPLWAAPAGLGLLYWANPVVYGSDLIGWTQVSQSSRRPALDLAALLILVVAGALSRRSVRRPPSPRRKNLRRQP